MLFNSSVLKELTKDLLVFAGAYSAGFLIGKAIIRVGKNQKDIKELKLDVYRQGLKINDLMEEDSKRRENESELKK